jgi:hypothetical protein
LSLYIFRADLENILLDQSRTQYPEGHYHLPAKMGAIEEVQVNAGDIDYRAIVAAWSPEERAEREKKLLRKVDWRLLPILVCHDPS